MSAIHRFPLVVALLLWAPSALACPVCGGGGLNREAYIDTAVGLTLFALTALIGTGTWLWRTYSRAERAEEARRRGAAAAQSASS